LASIIRATCTFDAKIGGFKKGVGCLSAYIEMNKKIIENFYFCSQVSAYLIENLPGR
jgi:hypothetical protein